MTSVEALRLVVGRELRERGRSGPYLLSFLITGLILTAVIFVPQLLRSDTVEVAVGQLELADAGDGTAIMRVAERIVAEDVGEEQTLLFEVTRFETRGDAEQALADGDVELVLIDGREILRAGSAGFTGSDVQDAVQQAASLSVLEEQLQGSGATVDDVADTLNTEVLPVRTLQGDVDEALEEGRSIVAYGGLMLLYMAILGFGAWTLQGVVEEKSSRVVEVLLATLDPWHLLAGKVIGIGILGVTQFAATVTYGLILLRVGDAITLPAIPLDSAFTLVLWFLLGYAMYSVLYASVGALVSRVEDAQSVAFPISLVAIVGFFMSFQALDNPTGAVAQVGTYFPLMAPFVVPIRVAFQQIEVWEYLASVAIVLTTIVLTIRMAARLYTGGVLRFGNRIGVRQAWRGALDRA